MTEEQIMKEKYAESFREDALNGHDRKAKYDTWRRSQALEEIRDMLAEVRDRFESFKKGNAEERYVYNDNGRFYAALNLYIGMFTEEVKECEQDA